MLIGKTKVGNLTLGYLGVTNTITNFDTDTTTQAKVIRRHYEEALDDFLAMHMWECYTAREKLTVLESGHDIDSEYYYIYGMPSDAAVIRQLAPHGNFRRGYEYQDNTIDFKEYLDGGTFKLHTDLHNAHALYTRKPDIDDLMPTYFAKGFASYLAKEVAPSLITGKYAQVKQTFDKENDDRIGNAMAIDISRSPRRKDPPSPFERARNTHG